MMQENPVFCSIITIGDELLIGQTIDTNSAWIAQTLNPLGIQIKRRVAVGDNKSDITYALTEELTQSDLILITGGLGPTADDITKPLLCDFFGGELVYNEAVLSHVTTFFEKRNRPMLESNTKQALVPNVCQVLFNEVGTAPGMLFEQNGKLIVALPGVPFEMKHIVTTQLVEKIKAHYQTTNFIHRTLVTAGEGESFVANRLKAFEEELPTEIKLAYLPKLGVLKLRLTGQNIGEEKLNIQFEKLKSILANIVVAVEDIELEEKIGLLLLERNASLSLAESCTGGNIAASITSIKGSSNYFKGGAVVYQNEIKENILNVKATTLSTFTAVSEQTALEMAENCRLKFGSTFALSITGYLEKNEHDNEIWIGLSSQIITLAKRISTPYDRQKNTVLATNTALNLLRKFIIES